jgi:hypothetical protein
VLLGLALRLVLVPIAGSQQDNLDFQRWGVSAVAEGFGDLYTRREALVLNYPPAYLYILALDGWAHRALTHAAGRPWPPAALDPAFFMLQKLNPIAADLATAVLLAGVVRRRLGPGRALAGAAAYALNPALIYTSGYWGQADGVVLGLLTAAFLAVAARRPLLAGALLGLAVATKPQAALFVPFLGLYLWAGAGGQGPGVSDQGSGAGSYALRITHPVSRFTFHVSRILLPALAGAAVIVALMAPFWFGGSGARVLEPYTRAVGHFTLVALNAFNGWWLLYGEQAGGVEDRTVLLAGWTARQLGLALLAGALLGIGGLLARALWRARLETEGAQWRGYAAALAWAAAALAFFYLPTQVHERYALYALPPLVLAALWRPGPYRAALAGAWVVSGLVLLNLYYITPLLPQPRPQQQFIGEILGRGVAVALLAVGLGCAWALWRAGRSHRGPQKENR